MRAEQAAFLDEEDPVADPLHLAEQVRVQQHRRAAAAQRDQQLAHRRHARRIEPRGGLVEQHQVRVAEQGQRQPEPLRLAARVRARGAPGWLGDPDLLREPLRAIPRGDAAEPEQLAVEGQDLQTGQPAREERRVGRVADAPPHLEQLGVAPEETHLAGVGFEERQRELHRGGLAGPVRAEQADHLARPDREAQAVDRHHLAAAPCAVDLAQPGRFERGQRAGHFRITCCSVFPRRCGPAAMCAPAACSAAILSFAVPFPPEMIAPA